jgi:dTMP kinase
LHKPSPFHYTHFSIIQEEVCLFITFEGIEGCGKTTQIKRLTRNLQKEGIPCRATLEPGGTAVGRKIRRILLDSRNKGLTALAELMLYEADRAQHVEEVIKPALERNLWVVSDRFFDATVVYQGFARGQDRKLILDLNKKAAQGLVPDLTFLLDCPVEVGLARATSRNNKGQDRFEHSERLPCRGGACQGNFPEQQGPGSIRTGENCIPQESAGRVSQSGTKRPQEIRGCRCNTVGERPGEGDLGVYEAFYEICVGRFHER